jgi:hypothetical protein
MAQTLYYLWVSGDYMKGLLGFVVIAMILVCVSYAEANELTTAQDEMPTTDADIVIVIDRNPKVQELRVYEGNMSVPKHTLKVSTGRETFDVPTNFKRNPYCSFTNKGDFKPNLLREMNFSDTWLVKDNAGEYSNGSAMPHSVFFDGGIAIHATNDAGSVAKLGPKDQAFNGGSGGCVRLDSDSAKYVFDLISKKDAQGNNVKVDPTRWEMCTSKPTSNKCTDERQWPIARNNQKVAIRVVDSRPQAEQDAAQKKCTDLKSKFSGTKSVCLKNKIIEGKGALAAISANEQFDLKSEYKNLSDDLKVSYNEQCNKETYALMKEEIVGQVKIQPSSIPANVPVPTPRPYYNSQDTTPRPPADIPSTVTKKADPWAFIRRPWRAITQPRQQEPRNGTSNRLWMDFSDR